MDDRKPANDIGSDASPQAKAMRFAMTFAGFMDMAAMLASPRVMAKVGTIPESERPKFLTCTDAFLQIIAESNDENWRATRASIEKLRGLLAAWPPSSHVPPEVQATAREILAALEIPEPAEGWDRFEGPPAEETSPPKKSGPRVLRPGPMSAAEWVALDEPGELFNGLLVEEEGAGPLHDAVTAWFFETLRAWAAPRNIDVFGPRHKLVVSDSMGIRPDVSVHRDSAARRGNGAVSYTKPSLVVEVLSPDDVDKSRDLITKKKAYEALGVRDVVVVDPLYPYVEMIELNPEGQWMLMGIFDSGKFPLPGFDGLVLDIDALWAHVAPLKPPAP